MKVVIISPDDYRLIEPDFDEAMQTFMEGAGAEPELNLPVEPGRGWSLDNFKRSNPILVKAVEFLYEHEPHRYLRVIEIPDGHPEDYLILDNIVDGYVIHEYVVRKDGLYGITDEAKQRMVGTI